MYALAFCTRLRIIDRIGKNFVFEILGIISLLSSMLYIQRDTKEGVTYFIFDLLGSIIFLKGNSDVTDGSNK